MIRLFTALLFCVALPALATTDAWPALYDVINVEKDDVLNVRSGPGTSFDVIGSLEHDTENIEVIRPSEDFEWALINIDEGKGWVSLSFIVPQPGQWDGYFPEFRRCSGTEPFWSLLRQDGQVTLKQMDGDNISVPVLWETTSRNHTLRHAFRAEGMTGLVSVQYCDDGMSDREFGIELNLLLDGSDVLYQGCCSLSP